MDLENAQILVGPIVRGMARGITDKHFVYNEYSCEMGLDVMQEIDAFEARDELVALLDRVERGEEIVITRHGRSVARLVPSRGHVDGS